MSIHSWCTYERSFVMKIYSFYLFSLSLSLSFFIIFFLSFTGSRFVTHNPCEFCVYIHRTHVCNDNLSMCIYIIRLHSVTFSCHWNIISLFTWNVCWLKVRRKKSKAKFLVILLCLILFFLSALDCCCCCSFQWMDGAHPKYIHTTNREESEWERERWKTALTFFLLLISLSLIACHRFCLQ
jgi:hypothetical protein